MPVSRDSHGVEMGMALCLASLLPACSTAPENRAGPYTAEQHYERACDSASRAIDNLFVHWENIRSSERMPASQMIQARQAMSLIGPVCEDIEAALTLDAVSKARVDAAFLTLESAARNLPRLPAGN